MTLHEKKEERLEALIAQLSQYPEALGDYREKLKDSAAEAVRNNIAYLQRAIGKPIVTALKELRGI